MRRAAASAVARACSNIALAKYWGKRTADEPGTRSSATDHDARLGARPSTPDPANLPAVPSISMTLDRLWTDTRVVIDPSARGALAMTIDGAPIDAGTRSRAERLVGAVLDRAGVRGDVQVLVESRNNFPTAAGLASSASGYAALAAAATVAAGLPYEARAVSILAREASASAARSVWGGFVELPAGDPQTGARLAARPLLPADHWDVRLVVALVGRGPKAIGSRDAMEHTRTTSPYYAAWLDAAPALAREVRTGLRERDLGRVGRAMEQSTLAFHASALAAAPGILYMEPPTIGALRAVWSLRGAGVGVYATMDAGPHVKALCLARDAARVRRALGAVPGVLDTIVCRPGPDLRIRRARP